MKTNRAARALLFSVFGGLAGCSSGTPSNAPASTATVSGQVANTTFTVGSALAVTEAAQATETCSESPDASTCIVTAKGEAVKVVLTNRAGLTCSSAGQYASLDRLELVVSNASGAVATGTYDLAAVAPVDSSVTATFSASSATCGYELGAAGTSGTITLTAITSTRVTGSYDVTFANDGSFSGSFDVSLCPPFDGGITTPGDAGLFGCAP